MAKTHPYLTAPDPKETGWPAGVPYIIGNEGCERFSYYGMKAILYIYVSGLLMTMTGTDEAAVEGRATQITHLFNSAVYAFPIIGAIIADRFWGKYRTIMYLSIVYCFGHAALAIFDNSQWQQELLGHVYINEFQGLYLGLALIGIGSGGIKPCVSANVGDQFGAGNWHLLEKVFNIFYFIINFGSAFSTLLIPYIRGTKVVGENYAVSYTGSVSLAFAIPGILMGLATFFFWMGRHKFIHVPPTQPGWLGFLDVLSGTALFMVVGIPIFGHEFIHVNPALWLSLGSVVSLVMFVVFFSLRQSIQQDDGFLAVLFYCGKTLLFGSGDVREERRAHGLSSHWFFGPAVRKFGPECAEGPVAVLKIMSVFIFVSVFWALFDQHSTTWTRQAETMNLTVRLSWGNCVAGGALLGFLVGSAVMLSLQRGASIAAAGSLVAAAIGAFVGIAAAQSGGSEVALLAAQIPAANPFLVMMMIPYTTFGLYPLMKRLGLGPTPLRRMTIGMFIAGLAFVSVALIQMQLDAGNRLHVFWQLIPYVILTLSEVMISITGLEFAYSQAPKKMKSVIMGFWLFNVTLGNVMVVFLAGFKDMPPVRFFALFAGLMGIAALLFGLRAAFYEYQDYTQ